MDEIIKVQHKKLGELSLMKGPQNIHYWSGDIKGCEEGFSIILNDPDIEIADIDFINSVVQDWESYIRKATDFMREKLNSEPGVFGIKDEKEAAKYLSSNEMPVELPYFIFWEKREWTINFRYSSFPIGEPFGISIDFDGEQPTAVTDLSEGEEILDDEE